MNDMSRPRQAAQRVRDGGGVGLGVGLVLGVYLLLLHLQLHLNCLLLVLAALVLEPDAYDTRRQARHLNQLLLH